MLRRKCSLNGRPKGPLIRAFQALGQYPGSLAGLSRENMMEHLSLTDIGEAITTLTGEMAADFTLFKVWTTGKCHVNCLKF